MIKSRIFRWAGHVARMEEGRRTFKILTGKRTGNIRMDLEEIGFNAENWIDSP